MALPNQALGSSETSSISRLPKEVLALIASHLDQQSAIKLRYSHRLFQDAAESRIYQEADLRAEDVEHRPDPLRGTESTDHYYSQEQATARALRERRKAEMAIRAFCAAPRRWERLTTVLLRPRHEGYLAILQFLSFAQSEVRTMDIEIVHSNYVRVKEGESFFSQLKDLLNPATFDNLTSLKLNLGEGQCTSQIITILSMAPALRALSVQGGSYDVCAAEGVAQPADFEDVYHFECPDANFDVEKEPNFSKTLVHLDYRGFVDYDPGKVLRLARLLLKLGSLRYLVYSPSNNTELRDRWEDQFEPTDM